MKQKLQSEAGRAVYKMRKAIVEPVFGQIKACRDFTRVSLRGPENGQALVGGAALDAFIVITNRSNIRRLLSGTGSRFGRHRQGA